MICRSRSWTLVATLALALGLATSACGKKDDDNKAKSKTKAGAKARAGAKKPNTVSNTHAPDDPAVARAAAIADKMCACKDVECADKVRGEYTDWAKKWATTKPDVNVIKRVNVQSSRLGQCFKKLKTAK